MQVFCIRDFADRHPDFSPVSDVSELQKHPTSLPFYNLPEGSDNSCCGIKVPLSPLLPIFLFLSSAPKCNPEKSCYFLHLPTPSDDAYRQMPAQSFYPLFFHVPVVPEDRLGSLQKCCTHPRYFASMFHTVSSNPLSFLHLFPSDIADTFLQGGKTTHNHPVLLKYGTAPVPSHNDVPRPSVHVLLETVSAEGKHFHHTRKIPHPAAPYQPPESVSSSLLLFPPLLNEPGFPQSSPVPWYTQSPPPRKLSHNTQSPGEIPLSFPAPLQQPKAPAYHPEPSLRLLLKYPHSLSVLQLFPDRNGHVSDLRNIPSGHPFPEYPS